MNVFSQFYRNFQRNKLAYWINILGFVPAIACVLLAATWISYEYSVDKIYPNSDRIITIQGYHPGENRFWGAPPAAGPAVAQKLKDAEYYTRVQHATVSLKYNDELYNISGFNVDPGFFPMFHVKLVSGVLFEESRGRDCVVTESAARMIFGEENALGKYIDLDEGDFQVVGVIEDMDTRSTALGNRLLELTHPHSFVLLPIQRFGQDLEAWYNNSYATYLQMMPSFDLREVDDQVRNLPNDIAQNNLFLHVDLLQDRHTKNESRSSQLKLISLIAFIVLLIACVNYINFSTATFSKASYEVGLRKILGASQGALLMSNLVQVLLLVSFSSLLAVVLAYALFPSFNQLVGGYLQLDNLLTSDTTTILLSVVCCVTLFSGLYPAIYISSFSTSAVYQGKLQQGKKSAALRKALVVSQFAIAIVMIISTIVISRQLQVLQTIDLGYMRKNVAYLSLRSEEQQLKAQELKEVLEKESFIHSVSLSTCLPSTSHWSGGGFTWRGSDESHKQLLYFNYVDSDFAGVYDLQFEEGEASSDQEPGIIINQEFAKLLAMDNCVGEYIFRGDSKYKIVGVLDNYRFSNYKEKARPCILFPMALYGQRPYQVSVRMKDEGSVNGLQKIEEIAQTVFHEKPLIRSAEQSILHYLHTEKQTDVLVQFISFLSLLITAMGVFALTSFTIEQKRKEILVRRINGASAQNIFFFLLKEYLIPMVLAVVIAFPLGYSVMQDWLSNYLDRYSISPLVFIIALSGLVLLVLATVLIRSWTILMENPSQALRND